MAGCVLCPKERKVYKMKRSLKSRVFSGLLALVMILTMLPMGTLAEGTATYTKISTVEELTSGKYVMITNTGYAPGVLDGGWITAVQPTMSGDQLTDPAGAVWDITVTEGGVKLTDSNGVTVSPKNGNTNGIQSGDYVWAVSVNKNGEFSFLGQGDDTVTLASNKGSENKFRGYKNATVSGNPNGYPYEFTLFRVEGETGGEVTPPDEPETITIAEALAAADGTADLTVKGVVTLLDGQNVYLQDSTGGICARMSANFSDISLGDTVIATGTRGTYNGLPQLNNSTYEKSSGMTLKAKTTTIGALSTADIGTYVTIRNLTVTEVYDKNGTFSSPNITFRDDAGDTIQLYKAVVTKNEDGSWPIAVGDVVTVTAAVSCFKDTLQLRNTSFSELQLGGTPEGPLVDGNQVVIYNPAHNKALSGTYTGYYNNGVDITVTGNQVTGFTKAEVWTVIDNGDGTWSFSYDGKNIGMGDDFSSMPLGEKNDKWEVIQLEDGTYNIKNTVRGNYMEWYADKNNWSTYNSKNAATDPLFKHLEQEIK